MKTLVTIFALMAFAVPAHAFDKDGYKSSMDSWKAERKDTRDNWQDAGSPRPKPANPPKPNVKDYK